MKSRMFRNVAIGLAVMMLASAGAMAQMDHKLVAVVPFDFIVGDRTFPAGEYTFMRVLSDSDKTLMIRSRDGRFSGLVVTSATKADESGRARLVFHRYNDRTFLAAIQAPGDSGARQLMKSKLERRLEKRQEVAGAATAETVIVSARIQ